MTAFLWIAGRASLDLCNTRVGGRERLADPDDVAQWLLVASLSRQALPVTHGEASEVRRLRDGLREGLLAGDGADVGTLAHAWLGDAPGRLAVDCASLTSEFRPEGLSVRCALVPVVLDAVAVARDHSGRVHECASAECDAVYLDTSRNGSRRWCSMERCGARAKSSAYYRRQRG